MCYENLSATKEYFKFERKNKKLKKSIFNNEIVLL